MTVESKFFLDIFLCPHLRHSTASLYYSYLMLLSPWGKVLGSIITGNLKPGINQITLIIYFFWIISALTFSIGMKVIRKRSTGLVINLKLRIISWALFKICFYIMSYTISSLDRWEKYLWFSIYPCLMNELVNKMNERICSQNHSKPRLKKKKIHLYCLTVIISHVNDNQSQKGVSLLSCTLLFRLTLAYFFFLSLGFLQSGYSLPYNVYFISSST